MKEINPKLKQYIEESDGKIQDLKTKNAALKKAQEIAQQQQLATRQSMIYMQSFSPLQNATISFPVSPNLNDPSDLLLSPSIGPTNNNATERTEVNLLSTPTASKSTSMANSGISSLTMSALGEKNDRFASQIGRILAQYFQPSSKIAGDTPNNSILGTRGAWSRTKVVNSVQSLVDRGLN